MSINYSEFGQVMRYHDLTRQLSQLFVGLEIESHRINAANGLLSSAPYPTQLADQQHHLYLKNDFGQTQSEVVTPKMVSVRDTLDLLAAINHTLRRSLSAEESLWLYSMPPRLSADRHEFQLAQMSPDKVVYMTEVAKRRDIAKSLQTGVHINIGLEMDILRYTYVQYFKHQFVDQVAFTNQLYMKIAQGFMHYRWLLTLLFGATPFADDSFFVGNRPVQSVRSLRNSSYGFGNGIDGSYQSVEAYIAKIKADVVADRLIAEREFYDVVRLKGPAKLNELATKGVNYLELRMFDVNPLTLTGVDETLIQFTELFFVYLMMTKPVFDEGTTAVDERLKVARRRNERVALENPLAASVYQQEALTMLSTLEQFAFDNGFHADWLPSLRRQLTNPLESLATQLISKSRDHFYDAMLRDANEKQYVAQQLDGVAGFFDLDDATQALLRQQLALGEPVAIANRHAGSFHLERDGKAYLLSDGRLEPK